MFVRSLVRLSSEEFHKKVDAGGVYPTSCAVVRVLLYTVSLSSTTSPGVYLTSHVVGALSSPLSTPLQTGSCFMSGGGCDAVCGDGICSGTDNCTVS